MQIHPLEISKATFLPKRRLVIIIHGYTGHKDYSPNTHIRPALLEHEDVHVLSVDYGPLAKSPCYLQAVTNLKTVAKCVAQLINQLLLTIFTKDDIHVIGFSLGAHATGMISNYVDTKLAHITGLDPAKPGFITQSDKFRLDSSDADFVDVIHTDGLFRGIYSEIGHVNFYPNGGLHQPGCWSQNKTSWSSCNHDTAPFFYGRSLYKEYIGTKCWYWSLYQTGLCDSNDKTIMGYYIDKRFASSLIYTNK